MCVYANVGDRHLRNSPDTCVPIYEWGQRYQISVCVQLGKHVGKKNHCETTNEHIMYQWILLVAMGVAAAKYPDRTEEIAYAATSVVKLAWLKSRQALCPYRNASGAVPTRRMRPPTRRVPARPTVPAQKERSVTL